MRTIIVIMTLLFIGLNSFGQTWSTVYPQRGNFNFKMPANPDLYESETTLMYNYEIDTTFFLQTKYSDDLGNISSVTNSLNDTYKLFAQHLIYLTPNSQLVSIETIYTNGKQGKEIGISYDNEQDASIKMYCFVRVYIWNSQIATFTIGSTEYDLSTLLSYKTSYFNSITFL